MLLWYIVDQTAIYIRWHHTNLNPPEQVTMSVMEERSTGKQYRQSESRVRR